MPDLDEEGEHLQRLRERFVLLTHGEGKAESPEEDWNVANTLGARGIPNRVDSWGEDYPHDWVTWRKMFPKYLEELVAQPEVCVHGMSRAIGLPAGCSATHHHPLLE